MSAVADWARIAGKFRGDLENPFDYEGVLDTYQEVVSVMHYPDHTGPHTCSPGAGLAGPCW